MGKTSQCPERQISIATTTAGGTYQIPDFSQDIGDLGAQFFLAAKLEDSIADKMLFVRTDRR